MAYPQITFRIATLLVFSILYLRTHAVISGYPVERRDLVCGLSTLDVPSCNKVCVKSFWDEKCVHEVAPWSDFATTLEVTDGAIKPLIWPADIKSQGNGTINGIMYFDAVTENTKNCKPILFLFYDQQNQTVEHDLVLMTPGQGPVKCEAISNAVAYTGVIDLEPLDAIPPGSTTSSLPVNTRRSSILASSSMDQQFSMATRS
jgi:hypothetical protein